MQNHTIIIKTKNIGLKYDFVISMHVWECVMTHIHFVYIINFLVSTAGNVQMLETQNKYKLLFVTENHMFRTKNKQINENMR